jgi:hypothetical protein
MTRQHLFAPQPRDQIRTGGSRGLSPVEALTTHLQRSIGNRATGVVLRNTGAALSRPIPLQRQLKIGTKEKHELYKNSDDVINALFRAKLGVNGDEADALAPIIEAYVKKERLFASLEALLEQARADLAATEGSEDDQSDKELAFPLDLWRDEDKAFSTRNFRDKYTIGDSLRDTHGMDYKTVDKEAFEVEGHETRALVIRLKRPKGAGTLTAEANTLATLRKKGARAVKVIAVGYYPINGCACPAMLMHRFQSSSKALIRRVKGEIVHNKNLEQNIATLFDSINMCKVGLQSLNDIKGFLGSNPDLAVSDIQFLIDESGGFFINDADDLDAKYLGPNIEVINQLLYVLGERIKALTPAAATGEKGEQKKEKEVVKS